MSKNSVKMEYHVSCQIATDRRETEVEKVVGKSKSFSFLGFNYREIEWAYFVIDDAVKAFKDLTSLDYIKNLRLDCVRKGDKNE